MTRASRTNFNSSRLVRFLADLSVMDAAESTQAFAEKLGEWLDFADAITLHSAHNAIAAKPAAAPAGASIDVRETLARVRANLVNAITKSCTPGLGETRIKLPMPQIEDAEGTAGTKYAAVYEPYHRFYLAHQREMEVSLRPLRANVRQALAQASATLRQLATLDAALDDILSAHERKWLATVPVLLEKRFGQLFKAHQQALAETPQGQVDDPALWMQAGGWLAVFCQELQGVLLAELDVRLQPTIGLIEAFSNEADKHK
jgi:hypothetical protein